MPAETGAAATNAYNTAMALFTTEAARLAINVLKATSGVFSLVEKARSSPAIVAGEVGLSGFPRLKKLTATGAITTARHVLSEPSHLAVLRLHTLNEDEEGRDVARAVAPASAGDSLCFHPGKEARR